jgi:hypothetical protein
MDKFIHFYFKIKLLILRIYIITCHVCIFQLSIVEPYKRTHFSRIVNVIYILTIKRTGGRSIIIIMIIINCYQNIETDYVKPPDFGII